MSNYYDPKPRSSFAGWMAVLTVACGVLFVVMTMVTTVRVWWLAFRWAWGL